MRKLSAELTDEEKQLVKEEWITLEVTTSGKVRATARNRRGKGIGRSPGQALDNLYSKQ